MKPQPRWSPWLALLMTLITISPAAAQSLDEKLERQWKLYNSAREILLTHAAQSGAASTRAISRADWEALLTQPWSDADLTALRALQAARISAARAKAIRASTLDFERVRQAHAATSFCAAVPKGGMLHVHPFGTFDRATVQTLLNKNNEIIDGAQIRTDLDADHGLATLTSDEAAYIASLPKAPYLSLSTDTQSHFASFLFLPSGRQNFPRFNAVFEFLGFAVPDWTSYDVALTDFVQRAAREHVSYVEFTTTYSPAMSSELKALETRTGVKIRLNNAFVRTQSIDEIQSAYESLTQTPADPYLVGIDILDDEEGAAALEKAQVLYASALAAGRFHRTQHAGEIGDIRNPRDAMIMGAERLGHGVNLAKDPVALEYAAYLHEPIEINLSSNLRLTDVTSAASHPFLNYLRLGLPVSLSTDDEGIFETDINHDCELAVEQTDLTYAEFKQMALNSIATSFATPADRAALQSRLNDDFAAFERSSLAQTYRRAEASR